MTTVELVATSSMFGGLALLAAFALCPERRTRLCGTLRLLAVSYMGAAVLVSPTIYFLLFHGHTTPYTTGPLLASDLLSWIYPDPALASTTHQVSSTPRYYRGLAYSPVRCWRSSEPAHGLRLLVPKWFALFAFLAAALIVALWLASRPSALRCGLILLAVVMVVPNVGSAAWDKPIHDPSFFTGGSYRAYLRPSDRVITVSVSEITCAARPRPISVARSPAGGWGPSRRRACAINLRALLSGQLTPHYAADLRRFIADKG